MKIFKTWVFPWWEVGLIKICLLSLGIILAVYFQEFFSGLLWLWWALFAATGVYFIARIIKEK
ncbi:MAG: hypothetical protein M1383_00725 [Patescibacteria group bacterium]|nr:hypothetical protein [Patescibacteria group bacterium]